MARCPATTNVRGPVAQWTMRLTMNQKIEGSSPARINRVLCGKDLDRIGWQTTKLKGSAFSIGDIFFDSISINGTRPFQSRIFLSASPENTRKVFKYLRRMRGKYLNAYGECTESI